MAGVEQGETMKFESVKCDECQRIQDGSNHWTRMIVYLQAKATVGIVLGPILDQTWTVEFQSATDREFHDLCGQHCAMKHIAKLLGWSSVLQAQEE